MKNILKIKDKEFIISIHEKQIQEAIIRISSQINNDLKGRNPLFIAVLNGAFIFAADILKNVDVECEVSFVKLSSYSGTATTGQVKTLIGLNENIKNRTVVILEDIVDTGITLETIINSINHHQPKEIKIATLLFKPKAYIKNIKLDYIGIEIPNDFIVGYGLDYDGYGRNLKDIYKVK